MEFVLISISLSVHVTTIAVILWQRMLNSQLKAERDEMASAIEDMHNSSKKVIHNFTVVSNLYNKLPQKNGRKIKA